MPICQQGSLSCSSGGAVWIRRWAFPAGRRGVYHATVALPCSMFSAVSERLMHRVRWGLTAAWLLLIASLLYDPWSAILTTPGAARVLLRPAADCVPFQDRCLPEQPVPVGTTLFWGAIVPSAIFLLLVFGHELWRRICPLSFLSQIPRALGWQRQRARRNATTGKVRYELAKVKPDSWLG
ncbi:MAG: hypothetical protein IGQ88_02180, partial [Gloeomargaritaceae cyanobacterium C42_A2020_066]|nr:hypothetical protein [Gloeomargaritaceae cyanobacterium C42_A2020_066]